MKKIYYVMAVGSLLVLAAMSPQKAYATAATYENHEVMLSCVPEAAGKVYIVTEWNGHEGDTIDDALYEDGEITKKATLETNDYKAIVHLYAQPKDGYKFAGFFFDYDWDDAFDVTYDVPVTFAESGDYTNQTAIKVKLMHDGKEYNIETHQDSSAVNKRAAEAAAEADWAEQGCLNHFFALFYPEGEANPLDGIDPTTTTIDYELKADYGTLILPFEVNPLPAGLEANTCATVTNGQLDLSSSDKLEANKPYIVSGTTGKYTFTGVPTDKDPSYTSGLLTGMLKDIPAPVDSYVLQNLSEVLGFYKVADGNQPTVKRNRCYLNAPAASAQMLRIGGATHVDSAIADEAGQVVFDMQGRRVDGNAQKGLYIVNGQKVLVK